MSLNYNRIREVERELSNLQLQLRLTSGPKKHALEMLRKKIEEQGERVAAVREKFNVAKKVYLSFEEELKKEEMVKEGLCSELSMLIQQNAAQQVRAGSLLFIERAT